MRVTAGLSDEDLIDPLGMPTEGLREGGGRCRGGKGGGQRDGWRQVKSSKEEMENEY